VGFFLGLSGHALDYPQNQFAAVYRLTAEAYALQRRSANTRDGNGVVDHAAHYPLRVTRPSATRPGRWVRESRRHHFD